VIIAKEDLGNTTFIYEFVYFECRVMVIELKNAPSIFSRIIVEAYQEYIYKTMVVYFDDCTIYNLLKNHIHWLRMMIERCQKIHISLNIKKCIFATPNHILLGHIIYKYGIKN
jgi:hypothetical protein